MFLFFVYVVPFVSGSTLALAIYLWTQNRMLKEQLKVTKSHCDGLCYRLSDLEKEVEELQEHVNGTEETLNIVQRVEDLESSTKVLQMATLLNSVGGIVMAKRLM